jgi:putative hemolysin
VDVSSLFGLGAVVLLVALNAFFVAGEFALVKIRTTRIDQLVSEGNRNARIVQNALKHLDTYIAATQLGITLASLALGWIGEPSLANLIEPLFSRLRIAETETLAHTVAVIISFALITIFEIVIGELVPKSVALQRTEGTVLFVARPLYIFSRIFNPFIQLMNGIANTVMRWLGFESTSEHASVHSVEELEMLVAQSREAGVLEQQEETLLRHVFDFSDKTAQQVMIPRSEIAGVPVEITLPELKQAFVRENYTRLPVYEGSLDNIIGLAHIKDIFQEEMNGITATFSVRQKVRPVLYVTEMTSLAILLTQMRNKSIHMAIVIDEYGVTAGMVTLEDVIEEIVGEVQDEFDTRERGVRHEIETRPDGSFSIDGLMSLVSFVDHFKNDNAEVEGIHANTLAGYIFEKLDRLPHLSDSVPFGNYTLTVEEMDGRRIARVRVIPPGPDTPLILPRNDTASTQQS